MAQMVFLLTEVDKDKKVIVESFGTVNQAPFAALQDALRYLYVKVPVASKITVLKCENNFAWITVEKENEETQYYELHGVEPLHYE